MGPERHLYVFRHGRTDMNDAGIVQGTLPAALTAEGEALVERHAEFLRTRDDASHRILASPVKRAHDTAAILARRLDCEVELEPALTEIGRGVLQGQVKERMPPGVASVYSRFRADPWACRPPGAGGENLTDVAARVRGTAVPRVRSLLTPACVLVVVTHGAVAKVLVMELTGLDRTFFTRVPSDHEMVHHVVFEAADGDATVEVLDGANGYAPIGWRHPRPSPSEDG